MYRRRRTWEVMIIDIEMEREGKNARFVWRIYKIIVMIIIEIIIMGAFGSERAEMAENNQVIKIIHSYFSVFFFMQKLSFSFEE